MLSEAVQRVATEQTDSDERKHLILSSKRDFMLQIDFLSQVGLRGVGAPARCWKTPRALFNLFLTLPLLNFATRAGTIL